MQINTVQQATRQRLQDDVLALIRSRAAAEAAGPGTEPHVAGSKPPEASNAVGPIATATAVKEINHALEMLSTSLHFEIDEQSGETIVKVIDRDSGDVLRQIPSEATVQIARSLDKLVGHLVDQAI